MHYNKWPFQETHKLRSDFMEKGINTSAVHQSQGSHAPALCCYTGGKHKPLPKRFLYLKLFTPQDILQRASTEQWLCVE